MSPHDDDQGVQAARDEAAIAGRAMTGDDAALVEIVHDLREAARLPAPMPSVALAAVLAQGLSEDSTSRGIGVVDLAAARTRRRALRYVLGTGVAVGLALGGTAAAAAVRDGVPLGEVPGEVGHRISETVTGALESVGMRPAAPATDQSPDPGPGPSENGAPGPSDRDAGHRDETDAGNGRAGGAPGTPAGPSDQGEGTGRHDDAPGRPDQRPEPGDADPGRSDDESGRRGSTGGTDTGRGDDTGQGSGTDPRPLHPPPDREPPPASPISDDPYPWKGPGR